MAEYALLRDPSGACRQDGVWHVSEGVFVPRHPRSPRWRAYEAWLAAGNAPDEPALAPVPASVLTATGYALWSALTRAQIVRLDPKDAGRLQARGADRIPADNPVIARLAAQAGVTVTDWYAAAGA